MQVYSSSYIFATETYENGLLFFKKQFIFTCIGFGFLFLISYLSWEKGRFIGISIWFISVFGLILTLIPETSVTVGGSSRWVQVPFGIRFQPSEWFKITTPFAFIYFMALKEKWPLHPNLYWLISICSFGFPILILVSQPDLGSVILFLCLLFFLFFVLGVEWKYIIGSILSVPMILFVWILNQPYQLKRIQAVMDPWKDPLGSGFQVIQSLLSFHSGSLLGKGLGQGQSKLFFLPEAHTDFTLSVVGEEAGLIGFLFLLVIYGYLGYLGMQVVFRTTDFSKKIVAFGLVFLFLLSSLIHTGVNLGVLPPTGLVLPFLSYGGNALVCVLFSFGWIIQIENSNAKA